MEKLKEEKAQLERKLEKSFKTIDDMEKKLRNNGSSQTIGLDKSLNNSIYSLNLDLERLKS